MTLPEKLRVADLMRSRKEQLRLLLFALTVVLCAVIFYSVSLSPAHYTPWLLYFIPVLLTTFLTLRQTLVIMVLVTLLVLLDLAFSPLAHIPPAIINRALLLLLGWIFAGLTSFPKQVMASLVETIENDPDALVVVSLRGRPLFSNMQFQSQNLLGAPLTEVLRQLRFDTLAVPATRELELSLPDRSTVTFEARVSRLIWRDRPARLIRLRDITAEKQFSETVRRERDRARHFLEVAGSLIMILKPDGRIEMINQKGCEILGRSEHTLLGQEWIARHVPDRWREQVMWVIDELRAKPSAESVTTEYPVLSANGKERHLVWTCRRLEEPMDGGTLLCAGTDITELKKAESELTAKHTQLQEQDRLKDNLLSMVSHEFRTPLTIIDGAATNLIQGLLGPLTDKQRDYLSMIMNNSGRLQRLVNNLLDLAKLEAGSVKPRMAECDLVALVREEAAQWDILARGRNQALALELPAEPLPATCDGLLIRQLLLNLVNNAVKFTPDGGRVTVALAGEAGAVRCTVRDTGPGIPLEEQSRIFDKFYQVTSAIGSRGTGLGLSICREIAQLHGATIEVAAIPGEGSALSFALPRRRRYRVLLVDDEEEIRTVLGDALRGEFEIETAANGFGAGLKLQTFRPELVLLDLNLPHLDGYWVCDQIRKSLADPPVIVALTGAATPAAEILARGFDDVVINPVSPAALTERITRQLQERENPRTGLRPDRDDTDPGRSGDRAVRTGG